MGGAYRPGNFLYILQLIFPANTEIFNFSDLDPHPDSFSPITPSARQQIVDESIPPESVPPAG
ncbi:MAG: hypothetical protein A2270_02600 [Elusimicrobia bacterium RIFOXYA12_FULL_51_18]|nr:MAG: hypothetical protein A2270_02600 [Elusimicrobia bacterium RIFOXYA12_FULL_51_18]OGS31300.1 MAG: hypothetical protein A2218_08185 [Elusimicrobia bacterium RIFOXYA2_FULL_53_38]